MIGVIGAGAFGTALAISLAKAGREVVLWARDPEHVAQMQKTGRNDLRLPNIQFPPTIRVSSDLAEVAANEVVLLCLPMQALRGFLAAEAQRFDGTPLVACCKGVDLITLQGPTALIAEHCPTSVRAILTGPSFATDIALGLPTALTLACEAEDTEPLQHLLSTPNLRLYRTNDVIGAELGGALKNVMAIAAGVVTGAGLGDSARAALMTRGYAEMTRLALAFGGRAETLAGLSGFGDLVLTCTSTQSRNYRFGAALGAGQDFDPQITVEGAATAQAVAKLSQDRGLDMPITTMVAKLINRDLTLQQAIHSLLSRPLKQE